MFINKSLFSFLLTTTLTVLNFNVIIASHSSNKNKGGNDIGLVFTSAADQSNNHIVSVLQEYNNTIRLISEVNTRGKMDWRQQVNFPGSGATFNSQFGLVSDGYRYVVAANTYR
eukprot:Pgem_evm2s5364